MTCRVQAASHVFYRPDGLVAQLLTEIVVLPCVVPSMLKMVGMLRVKRHRERLLQVGGMLAEYCRASGNCPAGTAQELLHLIVSSRDLTVSVGLVCGVLRVDNAPQVMKLAL